MACAVIRDNPMMRTHPVCLFPPTFNVAHEFYILDFLLFYLLLFPWLISSYLTFGKKEEELESKVGKS